jgi:hypothetical protein
MWKRRLKNPFAYFYLFLAIACLLVSLYVSDLIVDKPAFRVGAIVFSVLMIGGIVAYFLVGILGFYFLLILFAAVALLEPILLYWLLGWISPKTLIAVEIGCLLLIGETACAISIEKRNSAREVSK